MRPSIRALALACALAAPALALPVAAHGQIIEIGQTADRPAAACPSDPCQAMTRTSAFQVTTQGTRGSRLMVAPRDGRIVAFTIRLGNPSRQQIEFFDGNFGGQSQARLSVLRPPRRGYRYQLLAQSRPVNMKQFFGREVQMPLGQTLPVVKGDIVALTTPTWVPALAVGLDRGNAWRSSRLENECDRDPPPPAAQLTLGGFRAYRCLYRTARLLYRATLVVSPRPNGASKAKR